MKSEHELFSVITGDIVESSGFSYESRNSVIDYLSESFLSVEHRLNLENNVLLPFEIYRGDSFQVVLDYPEKALLACILLLLGLGLSDMDGKYLSARISIGLGSIDYIPDSGYTGEADGEAFRLSGKALDLMKQKGQNLLITTPSPAFNLLLETQCAFFDLLESGWTVNQKEILFEKLSGATQKEIAAKYSKSQSSVSQSLGAAGFQVIRKFLEGYEDLFKYADLFTER